MSGGLWLCTFDGLYPKVPTPLPPFFLDGCNQFSSPFFHQFHFLLSTRQTQLVHVSHRAMAPYLDDASRLLIKALLKKGFTSRVIASAIPSKVWAIQRIQQSFEMPTLKKKSVGRHSHITLPMRQALYDKLIEQPYLYRCKMADFLYRKFGERISERSIGRALRSIGWTRKTIHRIAQQRNTDLQDYYIHRISKYKSYQLVFVDESRCDGRGGYRRWEWSPKGSSAHHITKLSHRKGWNILPAYTQDGIVLRRAYQGSTDTDFFVDFIAQLLRHCNIFRGKSL